MYTNKILCQCWATMFKTVKSSAYLKMIELPVQVFKIFRHEITMQSVVIKDNTL